MTITEYLVGYGVLGDFGRFRSARPLTCTRGDRVVIDTGRGLEVGEVLREAAPGHAQFLPNTTVGTLHRLAGSDDEAAASRMAVRATDLLDRGRALAGELGLSLELIDVEVLLDGEHAVLHLLRWDESDVRPFVSTLSREFAVHVTLADLSGPGGKVPHDEEEHGCGKCSSGGGGCGSCGSGGCGSCSTAKPANQFADLRQQMEARRTPLL